MFSIGVGSTVLAVSCFGWFSFSFCLALSLAVMFSKMRSAACGSPRSCSTSWWEGARAVPGRGWEQVRAVPGRALDGSSPSSAPLLLGGVFCLKRSSLSRGVSATCAFIHCSPEEQVRFQAEPQALPLLFVPPLPVAHLRFWAASAESKGQAGGMGCPCPRGGAAISPRLCGADLCTPGAPTDRFRSPCTGTEEMQTPPCLRPPAPGDLEGPPTSLLPSGTGLGETLHTERGSWHGFNP